MSSFPNRKFWFFVMFHREQVTRAIRIKATPITAKTADGYDYDLLIIGCGVGGHGAALHAVDCVCAFTLQAEVAMSKHNYIQAILPVLCLNFEIN